MASILPSSKEKRFKEERSGLQMLLVDNTTAISDNELLPELGSIIYIGKDIVGCFRVDVEQLIPLYVLQPRKRCIR